jgi:hypothetical protein
MGPLFLRRRASVLALTGGRVTVRAARDGEGDGRLYTVTATAVDEAGNQTVASGSCTVPHDPRARP